MSLRQKSLHRSKNAKLWKKRQNQRAAKERKRLASAFADEPLHDLSHCEPLGRIKHAEGFRITVESLADGERSSFTTTPTPWRNGELSISPTLAGKRVTILLQEYKTIAWHKHNPHWL